MAGPSIVLRVLGDLTALGQNFGAAAEKANAAGTRIHAAFTNVLGQLNSAGVLGPFGQAIATADQALSKMGDHIKGIGPKLQVMGGGIAGLGLALSTLGSNDARAQQQLQASITATGKNYDDYATKIDAAAKHQEHFGDTAAQTDDALRILTQATGDPTTALGLLSEATDLAAAKHESLGQAAGQLGKTWNGNTRILKDYGVPLKDATGKIIDHHTQVSILATKLAGQGAAAADTFGGHVAAMKAKVEDSTAAFGKKWGPAITTAGVAILALGVLMDIAKASMEFLRLKTLALAVADGVATAATWLLNVALDANPIILLGLAIIGLVALVVIMYNKFSWFRDLVHDIFNWIKQNWPLLLDIIFGPVGFAIGLIIQHWQDFVAFFKGLPGEIAKVASTMWSSVSAAFTFVLGLVEGAWNTFWGWLKGLPGNVASAVSGMWDGMWDDFKGVINKIIGGFNWLADHTAIHIHVPIPFTSGINLDTPQLVPDIPKLAQGGLITQTGLIYAHAGEAITPIPNGTLGPAVNIEHATFATELDVDTFMRRVAWVTSLQRV